MVWAADFVQLMKSKLGFFKLITWMARLLIFFLISVCLFFLLYFFPIRNCEAI